MSAELRYAVIRATIQFVSRLLKVPSQRLIGPDDVGLENPLP